MGWVREKPWKIFQNVYPGQKIAAVRLGNAGINSFIMNRIIERAGPF
jgi:hypothetical protein